MLSIRLYGAIFGYTITLRSKTKNFQKTLKQMKKHHNKCGTCIHQSFIGQLHNIKKGFNNNCVFEVTFLDNKPVILNAKRLTRSELNEYFDDEDISFEPIKIPKGDKIKLDIGGADYIG